MKKIANNNDKYDQLKNAEENKQKIQKGLLNDQRYSQLLNSRKQINDKQFLQQLDKLKYEDRKMLQNLESKSYKASLNKHQNSPSGEIIIKKHYLSEQERLRELDQIKKELREKSTKAQNKIDSLRIGESGPFRNIISNNIFDKQEERYERQRQLEQQNDLKRYLQEQIQEQKQREKDEKAYNQKIVEIQSQEIQKSLKKEKKKQQVSITSMKSKLMKQIGDMQIFQENKQKKKKHKIREQFDIIYKLLTHFNWVGPFLSVGHFQIVVYIQQLQIYKIFCIRFKKSFKMQQEADYNYDEKQVYQLRQQMICYKQVQRNHHIENEKQMFPLTKDQFEQEREKIFQNSLRYFHDKIDKNEELKTIFRDRYPRLKMDVAIDDNSLFSDRMQVYVERRKQEIEQEFKKIHQEDPRYVSLKIERMFLNQKDFYVRMKDAILNPLLQEENQAVLQSRMLERMLLDRNYFKRDKPQRRSESKLSDKFELNMIRHEQARRKKIKQKEFMQAIFAHQIEFMEFHRKKYKHARKRGVQFKVYLEQKDQKIQQQQQKLKEELLNILKTENYAIYLEKVDQAKRERVISILQQTDNFLKDIGARVKLQKGEEITETDEVVEKKTTSGLGYDVQQSNRVYYNITHKIQEEVTAQPTLLEGGKLKQYQLQGLNWLVSLYNNSLNGILADEMGLGKTIQTISLLCYLIEVKKNFGPFLIIVPLSTLSNWSNEFEKWAPSLKKMIYKGSPQVRKDISKQMKTTKWNICLTTYEYVLKDRLTLSKYEWKYIIVDEGHRMKNSRSKFAMILGQQYQSDRRILLTGTPLQNNMAELWALLNFLLPKVFSSCEDFEKWFTMPLSKMGANEKDCSLDEEEKWLIINRLHQVLRPFLLRRVKKEVESELPRKTEYVIKIELSAWQKKIYNQIKERGVMTFDQQSGKSGSQALQNLMMQLRKICNHPYLFMLNLDMNRVTDEIWRSSGKFELLDRIIPKLLHFKHRLLIFSQMTQLMDIMESFFEYRGWRYLRLDGSTKSEDRESRIQLFNQENSIYNIFLLSTRAGGLGLNLQSADTVVLFDSDWNPMMDLQAQDRAYRIGQKNEVRVFRLVTATKIEEEILSKAEHKMGLDAVIIQAGLYNQRSTDQERKERLQDFFRSKNKVDLFEAEEIPNDEQINEWIARSEEEFEAFIEDDKVRYQQEKLIYKNFIENKDDQYFNYRLIQEEEVPEWITSKQNEVQEIKEYGRGQRERKQVYYNDDYSDQMQEEEEDNENNKVDDEIDIENREQVYQDYSEGVKAAKKQKKGKLENDNEYNDDQIEPKLKSKRKLN